jgi:bla regulator protein BlaR1
MMHGVGFSWTTFEAEVANHLWQSTAFAAMVALLALCLRGNRAQVRYRLWMAASLKFLIPFSLLTGVGGMLAKRELPAGPQFVMYSLFDVAGQPFSGAPGHHGLSAMQPGGWPSRWIEGLLADMPASVTGIWICGVVVVLLVWLARWSTVAVILRGAQELKNGREIEMLRRVAACAHVHTRVRLMLSQSMMEPAICGVAHPVLLWPLGLSERLDDDEIEAIVTHELTHVKRRDNLTAAMHMIVEALFWFHPMVWWMEARLVEERELACDEAVLQLGGRPESYAEGLLKACRFCVESSLVCVPGISGADLRKRVVRILRAPGLREVSFFGKALLAFVALIAVTAPIVFGQVSEGLRTSIPMARPPVPPPPPPPRFLSEMKTLQR